MYKADPGKDKRPSNGSCSFSCQNLSPSTCRHKSVKALEPDR